MRHDKGTMKSGVTSWAACRTTQTEAISQCSSNKRCRWWTAAVPSPVTPYRRISSLEKAAIAARKTCRTTSTAQTVASSRTTSRKQWTCNLSRTSTMCTKSSTKRCRGNRSVLLLPTPFEPPTPIFPASLEVPQGTLVLGGPNRTGLGWVRTTTGRWGRELQLRYRPRVLRERVRRPEWDRPRGPVQLWRQ